MTKISSKDQTLQRPGDQVLEGFDQDRLQQRSFEQNIVPEMIEQLEEVPKMMSQNEHEISTEDMSSRGSRERLHRAVTITWQRGRRLGTSQPELLLLRKQLWRLIVAMKDSLVGWNFVHGVHSRR